jgi:hypothetical protein
MYGPHRGDEIMGFVAKELSAKAQELDQPIHHTLTASHKGAQALAERTPGYTYAGTDKKGNRFYEKVYMPR